MGSNPTPSASYDPTYPVVRRVAAAGRHRLLPRRVTVRPFVDPRFAATLRRLPAERGLSVRDLGRSAVYGKSYVHDLETGETRPATLPGDSTTP